MAIRGALAKKASDQTAANYSVGTDITWDSEVYDTDAFHTTDSKITIPSAVNGKYGILTGCLSVSSFTSGNFMQVHFMKNDASNFIGNGGCFRTFSGNGQASTSAWVQFTSPPLLLTTADFYEARLTSQDASITIESESSFGLLVLDSFAETQRVLATMNADETTANYSTPTAIAWNGVDIYDSDAIHDPSSNNTKLIIPSALNGKYVVVSAQIFTSNTTAGSAHGIAIRKGGSLVYDGIGANSGTHAATFTDAAIQCQTQVIQVATGDEFEALYYNADTSITLLSTSTFGLRVVG